MPPAWATSDSHATIRPAGSPPTTAKGIGSIQSAVAALVAAFILTGPGSRPEATPSFQVIVASGNPATTIKRQELAQFFLNYSANLISKDPSRVLENTSSLMLMGYLIRTHEERNTQVKSSGIQGYAFA